MTEDLLAMRGSPGSPYTRKMLAILRYRRIPYRFLQNPAWEEMPEPRVGLIPILYLPNEDGEMVAEVDSTPIIRRLENDYPNDRTVLPADPVVAFLNYLLEDYGDEWLTKAMFHYRWYYDADIEMAGSVLPHYADVSVPDEQIANAKKVFSERQISRLYVVGSNDTTAPVIEASYRRFLTLLNAHLRQQGYLLGDRPASADFACFGQLTQLAQFDPTPARIAAEEFPRIHAWVSKMEDLSGLPVDADGFLEPDTIPETLQALLEEVGRTYVPQMLANAQAIDQGLGKVETTIDGKPWVQEPFPYQAKCLQMLRIEYARLSEEDRDRVDGILAGTGCEALVAPAVAT